MLTKAGYGGSVTWDAGGGKYVVAAIPDTGYVIDKLWVDGALVPDASGEPFWDVTGAAETIFATFAYTVNFNQPVNGTLAVAPAGNPLASGSRIYGGQELVIAATPAAGFVLASLTVNDVDVTAQYSGGYTYTVGTKGAYRTLAGSHDVGTQGAIIAASFAARGSGGGSNPPAPPIPSVLTAFESRKNTRPILYGLL